MLAALSASAISLSKRFLPGAEDEGGLFKRLGAQTVVAATVRAIQLLGRQFVLGRNIEAHGRGRQARKASRSCASATTCWARAPAPRPMPSATRRTSAPSRHRGGAGPAPEGRTASPSSSARCSAATRCCSASVFAELLPRVWRHRAAAAADINLTIDAEEVDRLELSLDVLDALAARIAQRYPQWRGFGLAVQAYQTRALAVVDEVAAIARARAALHGAPGQGRLLGRRDQARPGAGPAAYPVFTHKQHTDVYLACARRCSATDVIYPQFASHNAGTIAAIVQMARAAGAPFEMQRLHGMGEGVYREVLKDGASLPRLRAGGRAPRPAGLPGAPPAGERRQLLLRAPAGRPSVQVPELLGSPLERLHAERAAAAAPLPRCPGPGRATRRRRPHRPAQRAAAGRAGRHAAAAVAEATAEQVDAAMQRLQAGFAGWNATPVPQRAAVLRRAADALDARLPEFCALLVKEAFKTLADCVAEVREAVDFLRYYADRARARPGPDAGPRRVRLHQPLELPAGHLHRPGGGRAGGRQRWPPSRPSRRPVALKMVELLHEAGVPADALVLLHGPGETVGAGLVAHARTAGVCFTGSTAVARSSTGAGRQARPRRAADRRDRRPQRHGGRLHRAARAGGRRRGAERLPLGRPALLGAAPAVRAGRHRRRRDRDAQGRAGRAARGRPGDWPPTSAR
jgi:RHH-type proline utilization regulon transcriptional repressor/proline dehydrogenase/delta 1-pyrroline-5-carboxylate dehydrogenase